MLGEGQAFLVSLRDVWFLSSRSKIKALFKNYFAPIYKKNTKLLDDLFDYIIRSVGGLNIRYVIEIAIKYISPNAGGKIMTIAEQLEKKGKAEGIAEGKAEGIAEGKAEGIAEGKAEGIAEGKAEGIAEGKAEGIAEGKAEGVAEGKAEVALGLLREGISIEVISKTTGLSEKEIEKLERRR